MYLEFWSSCFRLAVRVRKEEKVERQLSQENDLVMKAQLGACQVYRFQQRTDLGQAQV